eukprot:592580-Pyramimonas_sp.AAC.1
MFQTGKTCGLVRAASGPNLAGASLQSDGRGALSSTADGQFTDRRVRSGGLSVPDERGAELHAACGRAKSRRRR